MRKRIIKILVCIVVFVVTLVLGINLFNQGNSDMTAAMPPATLPLVHMVQEDMEYNTLHGIITEDMDASLLRDSITVLSDNRSLSFVIDKYDATIDSIAFEVRSVDGKRLVEDTEVTEYDETDETVEASIVIKDLIDENKEYNWILKLEVNGQTVRYYTRIVNATDYHLMEKLEYVEDFHTKTFDKEAAEDLIMYLEPNSSADNSDLSYVDINCSFNQVTWGDLDVTQITDSYYTVGEIETQTASIRNDYRVQTTVDGDVKTYNVSEYYRVRYTTDRMYLLDFERTMNQIFDPEEEVYVGNKIMLGIRDKEVELMESDGGSNVAFVNEGQLLCYHSADKKMALIFSFYDGDDARSNYNQHDIKILSVDETGNVTFMVYGYMNRGKYEGRVGIEIYEYNGALNNIEERMFIPYDKPYTKLKSDIDQLSFLNKMDEVYMYLDGAIVKVSLLEQIYEVVTDSLQESSFQVSGTQSMIVWQNSEEPTDCTKLNIMNLNTGEIDSVVAQSSTRLMPLGFINEDLIYGVARYSDIMTDSTGQITFPMYLVNIQDENGDILKKYEPTDAYVVDIEVTDNLITLVRVGLNEEGTDYEEIEDDQIVNNVTEESGYNTIERVATQNYEYILQLALKSSIDTSSLKVTRPKEVLYEGSRELALSDLVNDNIERYYVYGKQGIEGTYTNEAKALIHASEISGCVVNDKGSYIWRKVTRVSRNQIMAITGGVAADEEKSQLAVCLETMLNFNGITCDAQEYINLGETATSILKSQMVDASILELKGASLDSILYYVNQDIPVLAMLEDGSAMLVIGFNELNVVVMDAGLGTVYKIGMNDATELFEESGNQFVTYILNE